MKPASAGFLLAVRIDTKGKPTRLDPFINNPMNLGDRKEVMETDKTIATAVRADLDGVVGNFGVRIVREGMKYGLDDVLTWDKPEPLVEFYVQGSNGRTYEGRGWFVSRYYYTTLKFRNKQFEGLCLDGGQRDLCSLTADEFEAAMTLVDARLASFASAADIEGWRKSWHIGRGA